MTDHEIITMYKSSISRAEAIRKLQVKGIPVDYVYHVLHLKSIRCPPGAMPQKYARKAKKRTVGK